MYLGLGEISVDDGDDQCQFLNLAASLALHIDQFKFHILVLVVVGCNRVSGKVGQSRGFDAGV